MPEQFGKRNASQPIGVRLSYARATAAIDVYALGVTLCELLTGALPLVFPEAATTYSFELIEGQLVIS